MKKSKLKVIRAAAAGMVKNGAPDHEHFITEEFLSLFVKRVKQKRPINHYRRIKRLVTRHKMPIGLAIDTHASKYFSLQK